MTITLDIAPEIELGLLAQAQLTGLSLQDYILKIVTREVQTPETTSPSSAAKDRAAQAANLVELFEPVRGLLTDEEIDVVFSRNSSTGRPVDLS
ncbi:MAG TPA: hypothetical protein VKJ01_16520 [Candidatus Solibacter sp.]|jgi:hypothetical protein|nr:hypothetical protein [Candidatus Solibacter sp.]